MEPSSRATNAGASSEHQFSYSVDVLVARRVGTAERVPLVADDGEDLLVGEVAAGEGALRRHRAERPGLVRAAFPLGVAVDLDALDVVVLRPEVDEAQLVLDVGERLQHLALGELTADSPFTVGPVAAGAVGVDLRADAERPGGDLGRLGQRADVHEGPDRHQAQRGQRPDRDLRPRSCAAATYGGSGFGGGGAGGALGGWRPGGPLGAAAAGAVSPVVAGAAGCSSLAGVSPPSSPPPSPSAARRSRERRSRCSGTSVTWRHDRRHDVEPGNKGSGPMAGRVSTYAQPAGSARPGVPDCIRARRAVRLRFVQTFTSRPPPARQRIEPTPEREQHVGAIRAR